MSLQFAHVCSFSCKGRLRRVRDFSVWPIGSDLLRLAVSVWAVTVTGYLGLAVSVWGHFGRNISVHKELIIFVHLND